jgi:putative ABC transport system permease protein
MATLKQFAARLRALFRGADLDRDFATEMAAHLEMATEENIRAGMAPDEARRHAAIRLGGATALQSRHRDARGFRGLDDLFQDLRFAARLMIKERWLSAAAIAAIALGIGANTLGFTIINAAFIRGFNFERAEDVVSISWRPVRGIRQASSALDLEDWRSQSRSFSAIAASAFGAINISDDQAAPEQTQGARVTSNLFDVLRQRPLLGRAFTPGEDQRGAEPVVIIGYEIWTNRFNRDPDVVGRILRINGSPATIIGVMPEGMKFPDNTGSELWVPFIPTDAQMTREARVLSVFGRLNDGVTREQAATEIDGVAQRILTANPGLSKSVRGGQVETLVQRFLGGAAPRMFVTIMGAVIFVLLIACANVANLLLSRAIYRSREVAIRYSLGATRWRIVRQLLIESVMLSSLGGIAGLAIATFGLRAFDAAVHSTGAPYWLHFTIDYRVLFYVSGICLATGVLFGLAPALQVSRENTQDTLKDGARGAAGNRRVGRLGGVMVVAELALTVILLSGAGLMLRSFMALYAVEPGFPIDGLTRMRMQLPPAKYPSGDARRQFYEQLLPSVEAIAGIQEAAFATAVPPLRQEEWRFEVDGRTYGENESRPWTGTVSASPRYFAVLGVSIQRGRALSNADGAAGAENIVVNQAFANRYFAGDDPIGRRIRFMPRDDSGALAAEDAAFAAPWRTIVGVSAAFLQGDANEAFRSPAVYVPLRQSAPRTASLIVRSSLPPGSVMAAVQAAVRAIDADQPVFPIETIANVFANERSIWKIFATLFAGLASIGLVLSAVGIYGVLAYAVTQRTQEIGVRMAIGARRWDVSWMFLKKGLMQLGVALAVGLPAAFGLGVLARFQLVDIEPGDPVTMIGITVLVIAVALTASLLPALKAARVDPVVALRSE